ncbi:MAG: hypothetical protein KA116_03770 [Proteobacteria bacterium]|nr:hypothetical protein [Pseudomonadota bacterium]
MKELLWLILILFSNRAFSWTDVVFDLDEVLIYREGSGRPTPSDAQVIEANGVKYWVGNGVPEMLEHLSRNPDIRISFFSFSLRERNVEALQKITLPSGKTAYDLAKEHNQNATQPRIYSSEDAVVDTDTWKKKDLRKIAPDIDFTRAFLVDDNKDWILPEQKRNLLFAPELAKDLRGEGARSAVRDDLEYGEVEEAKKTAQKFLIERNKSLRIVGMIEESMARSKITGQSPVDELNKLQWEKEDLINRETLNTESPLFQQILKKTLLEFQAVNPDFKLVRLTSNPSACEALMKRILAHSASP